MKVDEDNTQVEERRAKLAALRSKGNPFKNTFRPQQAADALLAEHDSKTNEVLEASPIKVTVAGRIMLRRLMGKASFCQIKDSSGAIQLYVREEALGAAYEEFKRWDLGDIVGASGTLFKTKTGELTIKVESIELLVKALRPLPDKFHGLTDQELCYRQRYVDLMVNDKTRETFRTRSKIIQCIREFFISRDFLEVETPMMHPIPGGAAARPFVTHHNTLDCDLYLRIAPELYLKRLVVGGFERVFEINRNFRNEGISTRHNPEFTMLEFYWAYRDYHDLMDETEVLFKRLAQKITGGLQVEYQGKTLDFEKPFVRLSVKEAILRYCENVPKEALDTVASARKVAAELKVPLEKHVTSLGEILISIFEECVEHQLFQPTFITGYPIEVSPLARRSDENPELTDRFEFFIAGREIANGFSELNDAEDQAARFQAQVASKEAGNEEAMHYDADYVNALEYGLPPTAGEGIGIDRLVMLFTDAPSIRDVILFPQLRKE